MSDMAASNPKPLVLIVDDDMFMRITFRDALNEAGFTTAVAEDGAEAVACFRDLNPDLVLMDLVMPGMDGFMTCQEMRAMPEGRYTPILVVTSLEDSESIHRAFDAGATDLVAKSVNPQLLIYRVRYMLRAGRSMKSIVESEDRLRMLKEAIDCLPIGITICDTDNRITYVNPSEAEMHGYAIEELVGKNAGQFAPPHLRQQFSTEKLERTRLWRRESINIRKNGDLFPVQLSSIAVRNVEGRCLGMVTACEDVTSRKEFENIQHLAFCDTLTGLPNRRTFQDRLQQALALAHREQRQIGLLFLDLDNFKDVNDTLGHDLGDNLLMEAAERLACGMREADTLARFGGDEFVVILASIDSQESAAVAAHRILSVFDRPFDLDGRKIYSSASIGIALYPGDGEDAESLIKCADTAMYHAKNEGKSNYRFFSAEMNEKNMRRVALESSLRQGLERREFFLQYQPKWDLRTSGMTGVEALVRWQSRDFGILQPAEFVPLAEKSGLILGLGEWVLRTACLQAKEWALAGHRELKVAVNISGFQFRQPDFLDTIRRIIRETGVEPGNLELEFTESVIMERADRTTATLCALKNLGVQLSIDDFGTGYSSLSYLKHFPIDRIKIDRSFIADVTRNNVDAALVKAIISMAHSLNLKVTAEGIEAGDQLLFLAARNCDEVQGYYLAMPMTAEYLEERLRGGERKEADWQRRVTWLSDHTPTAHGVEGVYAAAAPGGAA